MTRSESSRHRELIGPLAKSQTTFLGTMRMLFPGRASAVREVGALSDLDNISVRIADVAARLAVFGDRCRDELRSSTFPQFIARLNIRNPEIQKAIDVIRV